MSAAKFRRMRLLSNALAVVSLVFACTAFAAGPPPVLEDMGPGRPTPAPTEKSYEKKRLITSLTVQNSPKGETIITFEASDVGEMPDGKFKPLISRRYSLGEVKPKNAALRDNALRDLRVLEQSLLRYVDAVGGPTQIEPEKSDKRVE